MIVSDRLLVAAAVLLAVYGAALTGLLLTLYLLSVDIASRESHSDCLISMLPRPPGGRAFALLFGSDHGAIVWFLVALVLTVTFVAVRALASAATRPN